MQLLNMSGPQAVPYGGITQPMKLGGFVRRKRINIISIAMGLFLPWILFSCIYAAQAFSVRFHHPQITYWIDVIAGLCVLGSILFAVDAVRKVFDRQEYNHGEPTWLVFVAFMMIVAFVAGIGFGELNYKKNFQPYFDLSNLNSYTSVDPTTSTGEQRMDVGQATFTEGSMVDLKKSMNFVNGDSYCAAPITNGEAPLESYDFWAVGINCCGDNGDEFKCGAVDDPKARSGLRVIRDDQRPFFRLAIQQAESKHVVKANHPLFFTWTRDPYADTDNYRDDGLKYYVIGMFTHFGFQILLVGGGAYLVRYIF